MKAMNSKQITVTLVTAVFTLFLLISSVALCEQAVWDCPECGKTGNTGNFCGRCAHPAPGVTPASVSASQQAADTGSNRAPKLPTEYYPNGKPKKQYDYDSDGRLLQTIQYDRYGNILNYEVAKEWDLSGNATKSEYHNISYSLYPSSGMDRVNSINEDIVIYDYSYDGKGNCVYRSNHEENESEPYSYVLYQYDENNRKSMETWYNKDGTIENIRTAYRYDTGDHLLGYVQKNAAGKTNQTYEAVWENGIRTKEQYSYDDEINTYVYDSTFGDTLSYRSCNLNGDLLYSRQIEYSSDYYEEETSSFPARSRSLPFKWTYRYSASGKRIESAEEYEYDKEQNRWYLHNFKEYTNLDSVTGRVRVYETQYSTEGEVTGYRESVYDKAKITIARYYRSSGELSSISEYDSNEKEIRWKLYDSNGQLDHLYEYEYDSAGQKTKERSFDQNEKLTGYQTYQYDSNGNQTRRDSYDRDGTLTGHSEYIYDSEGFHTQSTDYRADGTKRWETFYRKLTDGSEQHKYYSYNSDGSLYKEYDWESY